MRAQSKYVRFPALAVPGPGSTPPGRLPNAGFLSAKRSQKRTQSSLKVCVMFVRSTNPDDRVRRIRDLCARAAETEDPDEIKQIASQLRKELHEQMAYLKQMVAVHRSCIAWEAESDEDTES